MRVYPIAKGGDRESLDDRRSKFREAADLNCKDLLALRVFGAGHMSCPGIGRVIGKVHLGFGLTGPQMHPKHGSVWIKPDRRGIGTFLAKLG